MFRVIFSFLFIVLMASNAHSAIRPENIVGVWLLDEGRGDIAADISENNHEGKVMGAKWVDGKFGKALLFEGAGEVKIQSTEKLNLGEQLTMMAYFNASALVDWHQIIAKNNEYLLRIDPPGEGTRMSAFVNLNGGWEPRASAFVPEKDRWYHFAATYNSKTKQLIVFVDGVQAGLSNRDGKPTPNNEPVTFGHWGGGSRFRGIIDDVAIFNVALDEKDIAEIAANGLKATVSAGKSVKPAGKLVFTWGNIKSR